MALHLVYLQKRQMSQAKANASFTDWKKRKEEAEDRLKEEMKERAKLQVSTSPVTRGVLVIDKLLAIFQIHQLAKGML